MVCVEIPAALDPVGRRDADADRLVAPETPRAPRRTLRAESACGSRASRHIRRCAGWRSATGTGAADSRARNAPRCASMPSRSARSARVATKASRTRCEAGRVERQRRRLALLVRNRRRRARPPAAFGERDQLAAVPGHVGSMPCARRARAGSPRRSSNACADRGEHRLQRGLGRVVVEAEAARRDAAHRPRPRSPRCRRCRRPTARARLMCVMCQSWPAPSRAEYWHIGATTMRLARVRPRSLMGENNALMRGFPDREGKRSLCCSEPSPLLNRHATLPLDACSQPVARSRVTSTFPLISTSVNCISRLRWIREKLSSEINVSTVSPSGVTWASGCCLPCPVDFVAEIGLARSTVHR